MRSNQVERGMLLDDKHFNLAAMRLVAFSSGVSWLWSAHQRKLAYEFQDERASSRYCNSQNEYLPNSSK